MTESFPTPDFVSLFPRPDDDPDAWNVEPRWAHALWVALETNIDHLREDVEQFSEFEQPFTDGYFISELPRICWRQDREFVREIYRTAIDIQNDLLAGRQPRPRNTAEEVVLYIALRYAEAYMQDGIGGLGPEPEYEALPALEDDHSRDVMIFMLYQDTDFTFLFDDDFDGVEDHLEILKPSRWFEWFDNVEPRDPARPYQPGRMIMAEPMSSAEIIEHVEALIRGADDRNAVLNMQYNDLSARGWHAESIPFLSEMFGHKKQREILVEVWNKATGKNWDGEHEQVPC